MPSPFPGMDPYLEDPAGWPGVHQGLIGLIWMELNALIPAGYVAKLQERLYVVQADRDFYPDVALREHSLAPRHGPEESTGAATALVSDPPWELTLEPEAIQEGYIEIIRRGHPGQVVTVVEVLSPTNKAVGTEGRRQYRTKQREVLGSATHLLEIDLLRQGEHTVVAPLDQLARWYSWNYLVCLSRGERHDRCQVWGCTLRQRLPRVRVPLAGDDADVVLDLQKLFNRLYEVGNFGRDLDYRGDPVVPLMRADAEWADALLRDRGFRK